MEQIAENKGNDISKKQLTYILNKQFETVNENDIPDEVSSEHDIILTTTDDKYTINLSKIYNGKFSSNDENEIVEGNPAEWETNTEGDKLVKYLGSNENVIFPNKLSGKTITTICSNVLQGKTDIVKTIEISNGIITIEDSAFQGCSNLIGNLILPDSITTIGSKAFLGCVGFNGELYIGRSVNNIFVCGNNASISSFGGAGNSQGWQKITVNMKNVPDGLFSGTSSGIKARELIIGNNVETIGKSSFANSELSGLLKIGNNVKIIDTCAFQGCDFTGDLKIPDNVEKIGNASFDGCRNFNGNLIIGSKLQTIGQSAFCNCIGLSSITIPSNVTTIESQAFQNIDKNKINNNSSAEGYPWGAN